MHGLQEGEKPPAKIRAAREDDRFVISRDVEVKLPAIETPEEGEVHGSISCLMLWSVRSEDIQIELTQANVRYCLMALKHSPPVPKEKPEDCVEGEATNSGKCASPKKKRRKLKPRKSKEQDGLEEANIDT